MSKIFSHKDILPERFSVVIPVHNDQSSIASSVDQFLEYIRKFSLPKVNIILVENGSRDSSAQVIQRLAETVKPESGLTIKALSGLPAGIGYAYHAGMDDALRNSSDSGHWIMLTASDLPFGSSDMEQFFGMQPLDPDVRIWIGSKAHKDSRVKRGWKRSLVTWLFRTIRRALLGITTGDTQGVFFINAETARHLGPMIVSRGFFYTTELTALAEWLDIGIKEIPVIYAGEQRPSSIRFFKHGTDVLKSMLELRNRMKNGAAS